MSLDRLTLLAAGLAVSWSALAAAVEIPDFAVADRLTTDDPMPAQTLQLKGNVAVRTNVVYSTLPGFRRLRLDLYSAAPGGSPRPLVVFVHGGGFQVGNPRGGGAFRDFPEVLAWLAQRGYVVASIEYRLSGEARYPAPLRDLQAAIRYLRSNAASFGIDPARVALWGMSAGAYLAALDAVGCGVDAIDPSHSAAGLPSTCVQGLASWFGTYDQKKVLASPAVAPYFRALLGCTDEPCTDAALLAASPSQYGDRTGPPALIVEGGADADRVAQAQQFAEQLREAAVPVRLVIIPGFGHGHIGPSQESTERAYREALAATVEFLDGLFKAPSTSDTH
jgi:acetyl esterase/lipase